MPVAPAPSGRYRQPRYVALPKHPRGEWSTRVLLDDGDVLVTSSPSDPNEDRSKFVSELARFDPSSGSIKVLLRLDPGMQVIQPRAAGSTVAWVEGPQDLRAFGWKLHLTAIDGASDRVVARDSGTRIANSVVPSIAFDGAQLVYTSLEQGAGGPEWRLHRLVDGQDTVIATLTNAAEARLLSIAVDDRGIAWSENVVSADPHTKIGIYDIAAGRILFRARTSVMGVYQMAFAGEDVLLATQQGLLRNDREFKRQPVMISPEGAPVDTLAIVGSVVLYNNFDRGDTLAAIDLKTAEHARLGQNVTRGPVKYGQHVFWFEKAANGVPARIATLDLSPR